MNSSSSGKAASTATASASEDIYDFSGVSLDLALLRSELANLQSQTDRHLRLLANSSHTSAATKMVVGEAFAANGGLGLLEDDDDEEWYPPSPPVYDVAEKLLEINRDFYQVS